MAQLINFDKVQAFLAQKIEEAGEERVSVITGYTAQYALYVHENMEQKLAGQPRPSGIGYYWDPVGAGPKFLEKPARELSDSGELGRIIAEAYTAGASLQDALLIAGERIQRESQLRVPVEYGVLKGSAFTRPE